MSTPRLIWCGSTNAFASAGAAAARSLAMTSCDAVLEHCERANQRRADHDFRDRDRGSLLPVRAASGRRRACWKSASAGGLDSTNVVEAPLATVIAPVSMDHTEFLGDTLALRSRARRPPSSSATKPVICAEQAPEAMAVIEARAARMRAPLHAAGQQWRCQRRARAAGLSGRPRPARSRGAKTVRAASVRQCRAGDRDAACGRHFQNRHRRHSKPASSMPNGRRGCSAWCQARWRSRAPQGCEIWLDGGHNAEGGRVAAAALGDLEERVSRPLVVIAGMMANKDAGGFSPISQD